MSDPNELITSAELAGLLDRPELRLFDCTTTLEPAPADAGVPYIAVPGRHTFEAGHIPGADFLDLQGEFSDQNTTLHFMMPAVTQLEAAFGRHGVSPDSRVVLYSIGTAMWATRFWWMLKSLGFRQRRRARRRSRHLEGRRPHPRDRPREGISASHVHGQAKARLFRRQAGCARSQRRSRYCDRQCARPAIPQGAGAQSLWPAGARAPAVATSRRQRCSIPQPRPLCRCRKPKRSSLHRASRKINA